MKEALDVTGRRALNVLARRLISMLLVITLIFVPFSHYVVMAAVSLALQKSVDKTSALPGETITYTIKYANPSTTEDAVNMVITDVLPSTLDYVGVETSVDVDRVEQLVPGTVRFVMVTPLAAGTTGVIKVKAKFKTGVTRQGDTAENTATAKADNSGLVSSTAPIVSANINAPDWSITKTKLVPTVDPVLDSQVTYQVKLKGNSTLGGTNIQNVTVYDKMPPGSTFVSASGGGVYSSVYGNVYWNTPLLSTGQEMTYHVVLSYPSTAFQVGDSVTNSVYATGIGHTGVVLQTNTATATHLLSAPKPGIYGINKDSRQANDEYSIGQAILYRINGFGNSGNVPLANFVVEDAIPDQMDVTQVTTGAYSNSSGVNVTVQYQKNGSTVWTNWVGGVELSTSSNQTLTVAALGLNPAEYITKVRWVYDTVPSGFRISSDIQVGGTLLTIDRGSNPVVTDQVVVNTANVSAMYGVTPFNSTDSVSIKVVQPRPWLVADKSVVGSASVRDGEKVTYNLRVQNHAFATGSLTAPTFLDFFPEEQLGSFIVESVTPSKPEIDVTGGTADQYDETVTSVTYKVKRWSFTNAVLNPGDYIDIKVSGIVKSTALNGTFSNKMLATATIDYKGNTIPDGAEDWDNNPLTNKFVTDSADVYVKFKGSLQSVKWVKGEVDGVFTKYPANGATLSGGKAMYRLVVTNADSNGPISNIVIIDKLPRIGDTGVVDTSARNTAWRPYLVNNVTGSGGSPLDPQIKVYYSTNVNPDLSDITNPLNRTHAGWSLTPPADITMVTALEIDFGSLILNTGESVTLEWDMRAPVGAPRSEVAWSSFGYGATYPDEGGPQAFLPSEPIKVGFLINPTDPVGTGNLGDYIWFDTNGNGIQEVGENGINGVLVNLYKASDLTNRIAYTRTGNQHVTNRAGYYEFPNLPADQYHVEFIMPDGYYLSPTNSGVDDAVDSDFALHDPATRTYRVSKTLASQETDMKLDAGLYTKGALGNLVWEDRNANGSQDAGEPGLDGVTVELYAAADLNTPLLNTITSGGGQYSFTNLDPGQYRVKFSKPAGYKATLTDQGADGTDSDREETTGFSHLTQLNSGQTDNTIDAGFYLGEIGDYVWHDRNGNGIQDSGELGIAGATVKLFAAGDSSAPFRTVTTNASGQYLFTNLQPGNYEIQFLLPGGYTFFSPSDQEADDSKDSDAAYTARTDAEAKVSGIVVGDGERNYTYDAGVYNPAALGDKVFLDKNKNGLQDAGEEGISGVTLNLYRASAPNLAVAATQTDVTGLYQFTNLEPGSYVVEIVKPPGYDITVQNQGGSDALDSDADPATGRISAVTLQSGDNNMTLDAGLFLLTNGSIGDIVWHDLNANGVQDAGEAGLPNTTVELYDANTNRLLATATTDEGGRYLFTNLVLTGSYKVKFLSPNGFKASPANTTADDSKDSDRDSITGMSHSLTLTTTVNDVSVDAGFYKLAKLGDKVFMDTNRSGLQDSGEAPFGNVTVQLYAPDLLATPLATTVSDANGSYLFDNLEPGSYVIIFQGVTGYRFTLNNQGSDSAMDSNADTGGRTEVVVLRSGDENRTVDAGLYRPSSDDSGGGIPPVTTPGNNPAPTPVKPEEPRVTNPKPLPTPTPEPPPVTKPDEPGVVKPEPGVEPKMEEIAVSKITDVTTNVDTPAKGEIIDVSEDIIPTEYIVQEQPENGTVEISEDGTWIYVPEEGFSGEDSFVIEVIDANNQSYLKEVNVNVLPKKVEEEKKSTQSLVPKTGQQRWNTMNMAGVSLLCAGLALLVTARWRQRGSM
jgi:uncharacterized repeat protein (TIGR01451 family)